MFVVSCSSLLNRLILPALTLCFQVQVGTEHVVLVKARCRIDIAATSVELSRSGRRTCHNRSLAPPKLGIFADSGMLCLRPLFHNHFGLNSIKQGKILTPQCDWLTTLGCHEV